MEESQQVIAKVEQLFSRPIDDWIDKATGKQMRKEMDEYLKQIEELLGYQHPTVQWLHERESDLSRQQIAARQASSVSNKNGRPDDERGPGSRIDDLRDPPPLHTLSQTDEPAAHQPPTTVPVVTADAADDPRDPATPDLDEPYMFAQALAAFKRDARFELRRKLQTGRFGTGYLALERASGREVVVKFPAQDSWQVRFDECAAALRHEAAALTTISAQIEAAGGTGGARVVQLIAEGELHIPAWSQPIPWIAQSFARGQRLSEPGTLPMRNQQEATGLRILAQVTGLTLQLYAAGWAHLDFKPDCLFWDSASQTVEVIDWNRATYNPDSSEIELEFAAIQRLVSNVLIGPRFEGQDSESIAHSLFVAFRGVTLSRGARLLLLRLLDPAPGPHALRSVAELHQALVELVGYWDVAAQAMPAVDPRSAQASSQLLSRLAIEVQRAPETSLIVAQRYDWYTQALSSVEKAVQSELGVWITINEAMRPGFVRIEQMWRWLVDVWPLTWVTPLSRAWFSHQPRSSDQELALLIQALLNRRWDNLVSILQQQLRSAPPAVQPHLRQLLAVVDAYRALDQVELLLRESPPNYAGALNTFVPARDTLPLDLRVAELAAKIDAGIQSGAQITALLGELADLQQQPLSQTVQRQIWERMQQLRQLGVTDQRYASQQQTIALIAQAQHVCAETLTKIERQDWSAARQLLAARSDQVALRTIAPDLDAKLTSLAVQIECEAALSELAQVGTKLQDALTHGIFAEAQQYAARAVALAEAHTSIAPQAARRIQLLAGAIEPIYQRCIALQQGRYEAAAEIPPPNESVDGLVQLLADLDDLAARGRALTQATTLTTAQASYNAISQAAAQERTPAAQRLWDQLHQRALQQLERALVEAVRQPELNQELLTAVDTALRQLWSARKDQLGQVANLLRQRRQQDYIEQLGATLRSDLRQLQDAYSALNRSVNMLSSETAAQIRTIHQDLVAQRVLTPSLAFAPSNEQSSAPLAVAPTGSNGHQDQPTLPATLSQSYAAPQQSASATLDEPTSDGADDLASAAQSRRRSLQYVRRALGVVVVLLLLGVVLLISMRTWLVSAIRDRQPQASIVAAASNPAAASAAAAAARVMPASSPASSRAALSPAATTATASDAAAAPNPVASGSAAPSPESSALAGTTDVVPTVTEPLTDALNQPWILRAAAIGKATAISATVQGQRIEMKLVPQADQDSIGVQLPPDLLKSLTPFSEAPTIELQPGAGFQPVTVKLSDLVVAVEGIEQARPAFPDEVQEQGAYLWNNLYRRTAPQDMLKLSSQTADGAYVLLNDGDSVHILASTGTFYLVEVVSNTASRNAPDMLGKRGWVRREFIEK